MLKGYYSYFDEDWFNKYQRHLLWLLNNHKTKAIARHLLRILPVDIPLCEPIWYIGPNRIIYGLKSLSDNCWQYTVDFRTHPKFAKRIYHNLKMVWHLCHIYDMKIANPLFPVLNAGFDTFYPDAGEYNTTVDGYIGAINADWDTAHDSATGSPDVTSAYMYSRCGLYGSDYHIYRTAALFDTSTLSGTVDTATLSLYSRAAFCDDTEATYPADLCVVSVVTAGSNYLSAGDFDGFGTTLYASVYDLGTFGTGDSYKYFVFNATGEAAIQVDGITKIGVRGKNDIDDNAPSAASHAYIYSADETGTSKDPKLVVTMVAAGGGIPVMMHHYQDLMKR